MSLMTVSVRVFGPELGPDFRVSSVSDAFSTKDVVKCLVMLSMDKWKMIKVKHGVVESLEEEEEDDESDNGVN
ncbi:hypothetical protein ACFX2J_001775 [Malus domestica]